MTSFTDNSTVEVYGQQGKARYRSTEVWLKKHGAWTMMSSQTIALSDDAPHIALPAEALDPYVGRFALSDKPVVNIARDGEALTRSTNGAKPTPLLVEVRDMLFTPGQPCVRRIFERDAAGEIVGFNARSEGHDLHFTRSA